MDANIVLKRVIDGDVSRLKTNIRHLNVFLAMDGKKSIKTVANEYNYDLDDLIAMTDEIEKMGLLVPVDGATIEKQDAPAEVSFARLPSEFLTGIEAVDKQHQRLVHMVNQLDVMRKLRYKESFQKQAALGNILTEMIDYTISHFAFEESLMEDAQYEFFQAHKRIHELFVSRAGEYKKRFDADEDIMDELYDVLKRWLFNHIRNDDKAYAPAVTARLKSLEKSKHSLIGRLWKRISR
jgi:hemerythrin